MTPEADLRIVHRAGRIAALQASLALAAVLLVVGVAVFFVDVQIQNQQIASQLNSVAATADDVTDPPPGMVLVLRDHAGKVTASVEGLPTSDLLARPTGSFDMEIADTRYRGLVADKPEGTAVVLLDLSPYESGRSRLLLSLAIAELAGIAASVAVVILLTRRSIRPLAEALALQRRFVADASHELRAPLTLLHTRIQLLARRLEGGDMDAAKDQIDALAADSRALGAVIEDLLASASMAVAGAVRDRVDVAEVADAVRMSMSEHAETTGVNLVVERQTDRAGDGFVVLGSRSALTRAMTALVDNALAHQHVGGTISIGVGRQGNDIVAAVVDDGVGVDPAAAANIFARFSHGHNHTVAGGPRRYGIGLALVREIAHAHNGEIEVTQTPGGGATFTLTIPAAS